MVLFKTLSGTIPADSNEITFTDSIINSNTIVEAYYDYNDIYTVETWQDGTTIGIVVSDHNVPVGIKVTLNNVSSFEPYDDTNLVNQISGLSDDVSALDGRLDTAEDNIILLDGRLDIVEETLPNKQNTLTAGDNITIKNNVISASGGSSMTYLETEHKVGTWIDGKDIYSVTIQFSNIEKGTKNIAHNIPNIDQPLHVQWYFYFTNTKNIIIGHEDNGTGYWAQVYYFTPTNVAYKLGTQWSNIGGLMATFFYTKVEV